MSGGIRSFLFSIAIVVTGLVGAWLLPRLADIGPAGMITRVSDVLARPGAWLWGADTPQDMAPPNIQSPHNPVQSESAAVAPSRLAAGAPDIAAQCDADGMQAEAAVIGDRLQLRIFETSALADLPGPDGATPPPTGIVFERLDLSGAYEVGAGGVLSLPAIGRVEVAGRSLRCIEALVSRAAFEQMRSENTVTASFAARPAVLVRGAVRAPGRYEYSPGLTVESVLAQAGAAEASDPAHSLRLATLAARRDEIERMRVGLGLERTRVRAALAGVEFLVHDPRALASVQSVLGEERVSNEQAALAAEIGVQRVRKARSAALLQDLDKRIETTQRQIDSAQARFTYFDRRREEQSDFLENGRITGSRFEITVMNAMEAERLLLEKQETLLRLQAERRLAEDDDALAEAERQNRLSAELRMLASRSDALDGEYQTVLAELDAIEGRGLRLDVTIKRQGPGDEMQSITAMPTTPVLPGDLVTVSTGLDERGTLARGDGIGQPHPMRSAYSR